MSAGAAENQQDPFESIIKLCEPIDSQNEKFPNCPFARESEIITESNPDHFSPSPDQTPSEIFMVSAPGSANTADQRMREEDAVFHTPPEHHSHSHLSSSEDQNPRELCAEGVRIADRTTQVRVSEAGLDDYPEIKRARVVPGEEFEGEGANAVDGNHELGEKIECSKGIGVTDSSRILDSGKIERECDGGTVPLEETVSLGETELDETEGETVALGETELDETEGVEVIALGSGDSNGEERVEGSLGGLMKDGVAINGLGEKIEHATGIVVTRCKKSVEIERDVAKINHSAKRIDDGRRERQLPPSMMGKDNDAVDKKSSDGGCEESQLPPLDLVDMLSAVFGCEDEDEEVDLIETAKRKGIKFMRPRWWPPPGEDF